MKKDTKYKVVYRSLEELTPLEDNPRWIKEDDFNRLCASIQNNPELFEAQPIILSDRTGKLVIIAGNQRYKASQTVGLKEVPTILLSGLSEEKEKEIIIRTNVTNGKWDYDRLANGDWDVNELGEWGVDVSFMGVDGDNTDIDSLFEDVENIEEKQKDFKIEVIVAAEKEDMLDSIKESINAALTEYEGVTVK